MAVTTTITVVLPRGKQEGGESYLIQVVAQPEVARNVSNNEGGLCRNFQSISSTILVISSYEKYWVGKRRERR
ncbi:unnamed protein product [Prunus armeniaca]